MRAGEREGRPPGKPPGLEDGVRRGVTDSQLVPGDAVVVAAAELFQAVGDGLDDEAFDLWVAEAADAAGDLDAHGLAGLGGWPEAHLKCAGLVAGGSEFPDEGAVVAFGHGDGSDVSPGEGGIDGDLDVVAIAAGGAALGGAHETVGCDGYV